MRKKLLSALGVMGLIALTACNNSDGGEPGKSTPQAPSNATVVNVFANASLTQWLSTAAQQFNDSRTQTSAGKPAYVAIKFVEAGQAVADLTRTHDATAMWIPDDPVWTDLLAARGNTDFKSDCVSVAGSPLVIAMWRPLAESLGWPTRKLGWLDISSLAADEASWRYYSGGEYGQTLRLAHAHPGLSGSGASTLLAVMQAAKQNTTPLTDADIKDPILQASLSAFEGSVAVFGPSPDQLGQSMSQRGPQYLGAAVIYENEVAQYGGGDPAGAPAGAPAIVPIYPFEGTFMATHPACVSSSAPAEQQEAAKLFRDYLLKEDAQKLAAQDGLRPATGTPTLASPFDAAEPKIVFGAQSVPTLQALQTSWQSARKPVNLVMVLDVSGSMSGDKIDSMRTAAAQFVGQMGDNDVLTVIEFSDSPLTLVSRKRVADVREDAIAAINGLEVQSGTALYDAIAAGANAIAASTSPQKTNLMIVLTDGLDTNSKRFTLGPALMTLAASNNTSVYTIAYGKDADAKVLSDLAAQSNGSFYQGDEANITQIYEAMSTAFGGSAGIGR